MTSNFKVKKDVIEYIGKCMREKRGVCRHGGDDSNRKDVKGCQEYEGIRDMTLFFIDEHRT